MSTRKGAAGGRVKMAASALLQKVVQELRMTPSQQKWFDAVSLLHPQPCGDERLAVMPGQRVQCTFPHDDPRDIPNVRNA